MYSLLAGFWRLLFSKVQYQILILGLDNAGKTTLLEQLRHRYNGTSPPTDLRIPPTVGLNIGKLDIERTRLVFWDLGGQSGLRTLWDKYFSDAHALVYVIDSCDADRLAENAAELEKLLSDKELEGVPLLVLANKQDAEDAMSEETLCDEMSFPSTCMISRMPNVHAQAQAASSVVAGGSNSSSSSSASSSSASGATLSHVSNPFAASLASLAAHAAHAAVTSIGSVVLGGGGTGGAAAAAVSSTSSSSSPSSPVTDVTGAGVGAGIATRGMYDDDEGDDRLIRVQGVSALSGAGVENGLRWLLQILPHCRRTRELQQRAEGGGG